MKKAHLSQTNPYLSDKNKRLVALVANVSSSSAIEGISAKNILTDYLIKNGHQPTLPRPVES